MNAKGCCWSLDEICVWIWVQSLRDGIDLGGNRTYCVVNFFHDDGVWRGVDLFYNRSRIRVVLRLI